MLKRPLHSRFGASVTTGRKTTTIRATPWPTGVPIQLYHWSGKPYRSPQVNLAGGIIQVETVHHIRITHLRDGRMVYMVDPGRTYHEPLYRSEGFDTPEDMSTWFRPLVKPGLTIIQHLMTFRLAPSATLFPTCEQLGIPFSHLPHAL